MPVTFRKPSPSSSLGKLAGMVLAILLAALGLVWGLTSWTLRRTFDSVGQAIVEDDLGEYSTIYFRDGIGAVRALFTAGTHGHEQILRIVDPSAGVLLEVIPPDMPAVRWPDLAPLVPSGSADTSWHRERLPDGTVFTIGRRLLPDGAELWFGRTDAKDLEAIHRVQGMVTLAIAGAALLAVGPAIWFAGRVLRPVRGLIGDARRLVREDTAIQRLHSPAAIPELRELAEAFNEGLDRVQALTEELEAANDQLAHELRTPLARIRGNVERILSGPDALETRDIAVHAIAEIDRASHLIQTILSIRAGESRTVKLQRETFSPVQLVREIGDLYAAAAEEKGVGLHVEAPPSDAGVSMDPQRLRQAICNLLDNAIAYTPAGGRIDLVVEESPEDVVIRIRDTGPGLTEEDPARIWRRFMRGSAASAETPGIGLGLSLVRAIAHSHRGEAGARNRPDDQRGAEFWIRLPRT